MGEGELEKALRQSEARFRKLAELAPDAIIVLVQGTFVYANPAAVASLGYASLEEFLASKPTDFLTREDVGIMMERIERVRRGERLAPREYIGRRKDGSSVVMEISSTAIEFEGQPAVLAFGRDATERKLLEKRMVQQDRLAAVGTLAAGVAHEINNPLAYILLHLQRLQRTLPSLVDGDRGEALLRSVGEALDGAERVSRIVKDLLAYSRQTDADETLVDLVGVCESTRKLALCTLPDGVAIATDYADGAVVRGSPTKLGQVVLNLLLNAADALRSVGAGTVHIRLTKQEQSAVLEVVDDGPGIPDEHMDRIFTPFFTTKEVGAGTGLGLSVSHAIVHALGGSIVAANGAEGGAVLTVTLPLATTLQRERIVTPVPPSAVGRRARVLVIDDERPLASALTSLLEMEHEAEFETDASAALAKLEATIAPYDVVLCDVLMPRLSGTELYVRARAARPEYAERFVFMTGGVLDDDAKALIAESGTELLQKPFPIERLFGLVRQLCRSISSEFPQTTL